MNPIKAEISIRKMETLDNVSVHVDHENLMQTCIGLVLLQDKFLQVLKVVDVMSNIHINFVLEPLKRKNRPGKANARQSGKDFQFTLNPYSLGYAKSFFLTYYRDGAADVDHIDLEFWHEDGLRAIDLTFTASNAKPSMTPEELKRHLGIDE